MEGFNLESKGKCHPRQNIDNILIENKQSSIVYILKPECLYVGQVLIYIRHKGTLSNSEYVIQNNHWQLANSY